MRSLSQVDITGELQGRPQRSPNNAGEAKMMREMAASLLDDPGEVTSQLVNAAMVLCNATSAGLSLLDSENGEPIFRWASLAGEYQKYLGGFTPRFASPCGVCLERKSPVLYLRPQAYFTTIKKIRPLPEEVLIIPVFAREKGLGTIWIVSSDPHRRFDSEDVRIMQEVAALLGTVLEVKRVESGLRQSEVFNRTIVDSTPDCLKVLNKEGRLTFLNKIGCSSLGIKDSNLYLGTRWIDFWKGEDRKKARNALRSAQEGVPAHFQAFKATRDGIPKWWDISITPFGQGPGEFLVVCRDISALKKAEGDLLDLNKNLEQQVSNRTEELGRYAQRLQNAIGRMEEAENAEREYLANELHDELGQHLAALKLNLENLAADFPCQRNIHLTRAQSIQRNLADQLRGLSFDLRVSFKEDMSLQQALKRHFEKLWTENEFKVKWSSNLGTVRPPPEISRAIFRVVQEALTNTMRHAGVRQARVETGWENNSIIIKISDQGAGFSAKETLVRRKGGLTGMKERVTVLGGTFALKSSFSKGTCVEAHLPYKRAAT